MIYGLGKSCWRCLEMGREGESGCRNQLGSEGHGWRHRVLEWGFRFGWRLGSWGLPRTAQCSETLVPVSLSVSEIMAGQAQQICSSFHQMQIPVEMKKLSIQSSVECTSSHHPNHSLPSPPHTSLSMGSLLFHLEKTYADLNWRLRDKLHFEIEGWSSQMYHPFRKLEWSLQYHRGLFYPLVT